MKRIFVASLVLLSYNCSAQSINTKKVFEDAEKQMQDITDQHISMIEKHLSSKEKEIMAV